jgi:ubiquinone/menaquinone biosynthesis C-methylase UbiE
MKKADREHLHLVRDRFTQTVAPFARTVLSRGREIERLVEMATAGYARVEGAFALDIACGPATFARVFARSVSRMVGVDFTPAMLQEARRVARDAGLANLELVCGNGYALPFADGTFDFAMCTYAFHHLLAPLDVLREMARVVRRGGRVALVDVIMPELADGELHNRIERLRDPSHATTLTDGGLRELFRAAGLRLIAEDFYEREREFDDWMRGAGWQVDSPVYAEVRREVEASQTGDAAGFTPHFDPQNGALLVMQRALSLVGEKQ